MFLFFSDLKDSIRARLDLWVRFLFPTPGWKEVYLAFQSGQTAWPVPGRSEANMTVPWPMQWIPHVPVGADYPDPEAAKRGFIFVESKCSQTGEICTIGQGVCCVRCGTVLHEKVANMRTGFSAPSCARCCPIVQRLT